MKLCKDRIACVQRFYDIGTYKWTSPIDFYADRFMENTTVKCFYEKGKTYYGLPYSFHNKVKLENFKEISGKLSVNTVLGTDCIFAIFDALGIEEETLLAFHSLDLLCGRTYAKPLGNITILPDTVKHFTGVRNFTVTDIYEAFCQVKPGDIIVTYFNKKDVGFVGHVRLITGFPVIVRDDTGRINPQKSYIPLSECRSTFTDSKDMSNFGINCQTIVPAEFKQELTDIRDFSELEGKNTNFIFNKKYSFYMLYNQYVHNFNVYCVPMRMVMFEEKEAIYSEVCNILREIKPNINLDKNGSFMEENILDSLEFFSLVASLSEKFKITLNFDDLSFKQFQTAETITELVLRKQKEK